LPRRSRGALPYKLWGTNMKKLMAIFATILLAPAWVAAQETQHPYRGQGYGFIGVEWGVDFTNNFNFGEQLGFGGEGFLYKGFGVGGEAAWSHYSHGGFDDTAWIGSADASYHFRRHALRGGIDPFLLGGFSLYAPTEKGGGRGEPGGNFGGGVNLWCADHSALRLDFRVHLGGFGYLPGSPAFAFRVGLTFR